MNLPNKLTIARVIAVPFFIAAYMKGWYLPAFVIFILASLTDTLDGKIARRYNLVTNFGKLMDPLADKLLVMSALICLAQIGDVPGWMVIIILGREFIITGMRTVAASEGIVIAAGMSGKIKTVLQMIAVPMLLLVPLLTNIYQEHMGAGFLSQELYHVYVIAANGFLWASLVMTVYSGVEYVWKNKSVFSM